MMQHRQAMAVKYCSTNLFDLLGSDIKFKSPAQMVRGDLYTPSREQQKLFPDCYEELETEAKHHKSGFNFELSLKREHQTREEAYQYFDYSYGGFVYSETNHQIASLANADYAYTPKRRSGPLNHSDMYGYYEHDRDEFDSPRSGQGDDYRKRKRKNNLQLKILKAEFNKCDNWNKEKITQVAQTTGLSESQVYKWCWDQKKKVEEVENQKPPGQNKYKIDFESFDGMKHHMDCDDDEDKDDFNSLHKRRPDRQPFRPIN